MTEDDCGNILVGEFEIALSVEETMSQTATGSDRNRSQFPFAGCVSDTENAWLGGVLVLVDYNVTGFVRLKADLNQVILI